VTYKYCPFCDAGRKAEARKKAARKQQATALFSGLFGGRDDTEGMDAPVQDPEARETRHRRREHTEHRPEHRSGHRSEHGDEAPAHRRAAPVETNIPRSEGFRKKKTSEMTEEEKRVYRAEREARAAARKRERDRAARAAALVDVSEPAQGTLAEEETIQAAATAVPVASPTGMETVEITIDPMAAPVEPTPEAVVHAAQENAAAMDALQDLVADGSGEQMNAAPAEAAAPAGPVEVEVPTPVPEVNPRPIDPQSILQGDSELDALLSEIRGLLDDTPAAVPAASGAAAQAVTSVMPDAPGLEPMAAEPAAVAPEGEIPVTVPGQEPAPAVQAEAPQEAAAPAAEAVQAAASEAPQAAAEAVEAPPAAEPVQAAEAQAQPVQTEAQPAQAAAEPVQAENYSGVNYDDPELIWSPETTAAVEAAALRKSAPARTRRAAQGQTRQQNRKKQKPLVPIIAAVIVVALAALLVAKVIAPAIQGSKEAETIYLDKSEVTLTYEGATETLTPIFVPKGSSGEVQWTCDNWGVVDVDPNGLLTAKAPGVASVRATLPNGSTTSTLVNCVWGGDPAAVTEGGDAAAAAPAETVTVGLNTTDMTLDGEGKTQQLVLNGTTSAVKWTSSKPSVATVAADGTVTAVSKGSATVTAESNGSKFNCAVRCIW